MYKKVALLVVLSSTLSGMDADTVMTDAATTQLICFFILLPNEVREQIAKYLDYNVESDAAFIARIKTQSTVLAAPVGQFSEQKNVMRHGTMRARLQMQLKHIRGFTA